MIPSCLEDKQSCLDTFEIKIYPLFQILQATLDDCKKTVKKSEEQEEEEEDEESYSYISPDL